MKFLSTLRDAILGTTARGTGRGRPKPGGFRPRLEGLEDRWCPSCTVVQDGGTLLITGDHNDNYISVSQNGEHVAVSCDGAEAVSYTGINRVEVRAGAGGDFVDYGIDGDLDRDMAVAIDLGPGGNHAGGFGDTTSINVYGGTISKHLAIDVQGGAGNDQVYFGVYYTSVSESGWLDVRLDLGAGNDFISGDTYVGVDGRFDYTADGGAGNDNVGLELRTLAGDGGTVNVDLRGGTGDDYVGLYGYSRPGHTLNANLSGGMGNDSLSFDFSANSATVHGLLDGGQGRDTCVEYDPSGTSDVEVKNCES